MEVGSEIRVSLGGWRLAEAWCTCARSLSACASGERAVLTLLACASSERATMMVTEKSTTTTTSIRTVTPSTSVVKGPLACSSEMMAIADEGDL